MPIGIRQISRLRKALWLWIIVGAAIVAHAVLFSGGVVEPFLLWQLERYQAVDEGSTMLALLAVVVGLPALIRYLNFRLPNRRKKGKPFMFPHFPEVSCSEIRHRLHALSARSSGIADRAQTLLSDAARTSQGGHRRH